MVKKLIPEMSLTGNGLRDWIVQRFSSVILTVFFFVMCVFFLKHPHPDYKEIHTLFAATWMQIFTLLTLLSMLLHAWVGIWTVITDYINPIVIRIILQALVILALVIYFFWGLEILLKLV